MPAHSTEKPLRTVVIGYGNPLRGDDGVGQRAAVAVAAWGLPNVRALAVHQLTPELADTLANAQQVIFVDAGLEAADGTLRVSRIEPTRWPTSLGHVSDPGQLLALTEALYGGCPSAWSVIVPASSCAVGAPLTSLAEQGLAEALRQIAVLVNGVPDEMLSELR
jgi:hydrogenase maturation protease